MSAARSSHGAQRGQTLVEFALVAAVFMLIVMGIFDFGRAILYYNMLSNASREGARYGIVKGRTGEQVCAVAIAATQLPGIDYAKASGCGTFDSVLTASAAQVPESGYKVVRVTISYTFSPITPLIGAIVGDVPLKASSTMYVEN